MNNLPDQANPSEIILYQTEDGKTRIEVRMQAETVWLLVVLEERVKGWVRAFAVLERTVWDDESEPPRMRGDLADDQVHPIGNPEPVSAGLNECAAVHELGEEPFEGGTFVTR